LGIDGTKGLIHEEDHGIDGQSSRQAGALLHAAGQFMGIVMLEVFQPHPLQIIARYIAPFFLWHAAQLQTELYVREHRTPGEQSKGLKNHSAIRSWGRDSLSIDQNLAAIMGNETVDNFKQRSFAASAWADDADKLILTDGEVHLRKSLDLCGAVFVRFLKAFRDPLDLNHLSSLTLGVQNVPVVQVVKQINFPVRFERLELFEHLEPFCAVYFPVMTLSSLPGS
jgi:hypothetical protein